MPPSGSRGYGGGLQFSRAVLGQGCLGLDYFVTLMGVSRAHEPLRPVALHQRPAGRGSTGSGRTVACQGLQLRPQVLSRLQGRFYLLPASASPGPQPRASCLGASPAGGPEPHTPRLGGPCLRPGEPAVVGPSSSCEWKGTPGRVCSSPEAGRPPAGGSVPGGARSKPSSEAPWLPAGDRGYTGPDMRTLHRVPGVQQDAAQG